MDRPSLGIAVQRAARVLTLLEIALLAQDSLDPGIDFPGHLRWNASSFKLTLN
jgi:hypothetical protein